MDVVSLEKLLRRIEPVRDASISLDSDNLAQLVRYLNGPDEWLAERATNLIANTGSDEVRPFLEAALKSRSEPVRIAAAIGLSRLPTLASEAFEIALLDKSSSVPRFALRSLAQRLKNRNEVVPKSIEKIVRDLAEQSSSQSILQLARLVDARLRGSPIDVDQFVDAVRAGATPSDIGQILEKRSSGFLPKAVEPQVGAVFAVAAIETAAIVGPDALSSIVGPGITHLEPAVRRSVARALRLVHDPDVAAGALSRLLDDPDEAVRKEAIAPAVLSEIEGLHYKVRAIASRDPNSSVRNAARSAIARNEEAIQSTQGGDATPQGKGSLFGTWTIVAINRLEVHSNQSSISTADSIGQLILAPEGRYSLILLQPQPERSRTVSDAFENGTAREHENIPGNVLAHFGNYSVSDDHTIVTFHIEACTYGRWAGTAQKHPYSSAGDELKVSNLLPTTDEQMEFVFKRIK